MSNASEQPKKKNWFARHKVLTVIGALILIGAVGAGMNGSKNDGGDTAQPAANGEQATAQSGEKSAEETMPGIGEAATAGNFEFTVTEVETGVESVGGEHFGEDAQGQFVFVRIDVKNVGNDASTLSSSFQKLVDDQGREHEANASAALYVDDSNSLYERVNPGNAVSGVLVFDIPADSTPVSVKLQEGFSSSVEVSLK